MKQDQPLRNQLTKLLQGGQAFTPAGDLLAGISAREASQKVPGLPYTIWQLIEHLRITLYDILDFSRDPAYQSPAWPEGYWPAEAAPPSPAELEKSIQTILAGVDAMIRMVQDPARDLFEPFAHGQGQNLLREALLVAEHNAYHLGQIVVLRRLVGTWKEA